MRPGLFSIVIAPLATSDRSRLQPSTVKAELNAFPFGPVLACFHPNKSRSSLADWSAFSASSAGEKRESRHRKLRRVLPASGSEETTGSGIPG